jgi:hypothetical protein
VLGLRPCLAGLQVLHSCYMAKSSHDTKLYHVNLLAWLKNKGFLQSKATYTYHAVTVKQAASKLVSECQHIKVQSTMTIMCKESNSMIV